MNTLRSVKTVTLSEDACASLAARKREGESICEVVRRVTRTDRSLREFAGLWADIPREKFEEFDDWLRRTDRASRSELLRLGRRRSK